MGQKLFNITYGRVCVFSLPLKSVAATAGHQLHDTLQVNAAGYNEKILRVKIPEGSASGADAPKPQVLNVEMEPTVQAAVVTANSTVRNDERYTYWVLHGVRASGTTARARATAETAAVLLDDGHRPADERDGMSDGAEDDADDSMRPAEPVSSSSASAAVSGHRLFRCCVVNRTVIIAYLALVATAL